MHHALAISEILLSIFAHCRPNLPSRRRATPDLAALARTCCAFKEPALDVLWEDLDDLSPLMRCIPAACFEVKMSAGYEGEASHQLFGSRYFFSRMLTRTEWDVLRSYAHRIRSIVDVGKIKLDLLSLRVFSSPPTAEPLFPNLRYLRCEYRGTGIALWNLPFPSLISLDVVFEDAFALDDYLKSFPDSSPHIKRLSVRVRHLGDRLVKIEPNFISRWRNLQSMVCPQITLDADVLLHLSRMPALSRLTFRQIVTLPASNSPLSFPRLHHLTVHSTSLNPISRLLSQIQMPALVDLAAIIDSCPSKPELASFLASLDTSSACHTIERLTLDQSVPSMNTNRGPDPLSLDVEDLRPCTALHHLTCLQLNITWNVTLTDDDVLALASAWPYLERLVLNAYSGWNTPGGITLHGLHKLLRMCPSLRWIALALDTHGYTTHLRDEPDPLTAPDPGPSPEQSGSWSRGQTRTPPRTLSLDVLDSAIAPESVLAVAAFFAAIVPGADVSFGAWRGGKMVRRTGWEAYRTRWENVFRWARRPSAYLRHYMVGARPLFLLAS